MGGHMDLRMGLGALAGLAGGVLSGLFGIGGGIILVPLLGVILGVGQHQAQGMTLAVMILPNSLPAVLHYRRSGVRLELRLVAWMALGFLGGVLGGAQLATLLSGRGLRLLFCVFLAYAASRMLRPGKAGGGAGEAVWQVHAGRGLVIGALGGLASGLLGIGGGIVMIPLLVLWMGQSQREAQLTSLALLLLPLGLPGLAVYLAHGTPMPWAVLACTAGGFVAGAHLGARGASAVKESRLRQSFGVLLGALAVWLAFR